MNDQEIQRAIDSMPDGGLIHLPVGIHVIEKTIFLHDNIKLQGDGPSTILKRNILSCPLIHNKGRTKATGGSGQGNKNIIISDLSIDGNKGDELEYKSNEQAIWLSLTQDSLIENIWTYNNRTNGIVLEYCQNISITNCIAHDNLKNGFYLSGCDRISLSNCIGHNNGTSFAIACSWYCSVSNCIGSNDIRASLGSGRDTQYLSVIGGNYSGVDVSVEPILVSPPSRQVIYDKGLKYGTSNSIFSGMIINSKTSGVRLILGSGNLISNNIIHDTGLNGIMLFGSKENSIIYNMISNTGLANNKDYCSGITIVADSVLPDCVRNIIEGNIISNVPIGIQIYQIGSGNTSNTYILRNKLHAIKPWDIRIQDFSSEGNLII